MNKNQLIFHYAQAAKWFEIRAFAVFLHIRLTARTVTHYCNVTVNLRKRLILRSESRVCIRNKALFSARNRSFSQTQITHMDYP